MEELKAWGKKNPNLVSLISFIVFFLAIGWILRYQWLLAFLVCASLAIHEYSHCLAMIIKKIPVKAVIFIPFMGAVAIGGGKRAWTKKEECFIAAAGPIMGYLSALPVYLLGETSGNPVYSQAVYYIVIINLFNMLPVSPLDGGRIVKSILMSIGFKYRIVGFVIWGILAGGAVCLLFQLRVSLLIAILVIWFAFQEFSREWQHYKMGLDFGAPLLMKQKLLYGALYVVLAGWPLVYYFILK